MKAATSCKIIRFLLAGLLMGLLINLLTASNVLAAGESCSRIFVKSTATEASDRAAKIAAAEDNTLKASEINYKITGAQNTETVILIHGLGSSSKTFKQVSAELSKKYRVISYDQRGHGQTVGRGENYSTYQMAADLKVLVDHLGVKKFHIVGHSLGARTAMRFVDMYPERVKSIFIEDMDMRKRQDDAPEKIDKHLRYARAIGRMNTFYPKAEDAVAALAPEFNGDEEKALRYLNRMSYVDKDGALYLAPNAAATIYFGFQGNVDDFGSTLQKLTVPVLFLRANPEHSPFFDDAGVAHIKAHAHNYQIKQMDDAGHTIHAGDTLDEYMQALKTFLAKNK